MSNHDLRYLRSNGVEELYRSILPPGVSPNHLSLPLLNQLTAASAAAAATAGTTSQPGLPALPLAPPGAPSHLHQPPITTKQSQKQSKADLEKQLRLQQQQLLYLNAVYAQHFQGLATASPEIGQLRGTNHLSPDQFLSAIQSHSNQPTSYGHSPLVDMRRLLLVQNDKLLQQQQQPNKESNTEKLFKGAAGSAFTPVTPKQKALNRLPMPKTSPHRSASVPSQPLSKGFLDENKKIKSEVPKCPPTITPSGGGASESLVKTPEIVQKDVIESKTIVEVVQVNEADSMTSNNTNVKEEIIVVDQAEQAEPTATTETVATIEQQTNRKSPEVKPDEEEELQSKEVSSSNLPVVSPKPTPIQQLPDQMQPLKKRRLKAVIADALNQNLDESYSSNYSSRNISPIQAIITSDSDTLPLAVIRDKLNQSQSIAKHTPTTITPMKLRAEDHITDIESSLATFKSHVSTPKSSTPSSPTSSLSNKDGPHGKSPLATPEKRTGSSRRKVREPTASIPAVPEVTYSTMDASEMQQLARYIISGSDSDNTVESSGDDFHSRAYVDSTESRRKTRSPGAATVKPKKKVVPKKPGRKMASGKKKWKSEDEDDDHLAKFFAADAELNVENRVAITTPTTTKPKVGKKRKPAAESKEQKEANGNNRKRKSGTPRKLEIIDEKQLDAWETAVDTEVVKNSSNGLDYLIKEHDASWYSVTCFCGQPFAGRPMIECDLCGMWVHMNCAKIKKNKVPDNYNCTQCRRDAKAVKTRQRR